jgi:sodium/bile acid cotransporter 7
MRNFWRQHWFLTTLALLILSGLSVGGLGYGPVVEPYADLLKPRWITAAVLFLMSFSLDSSRLWGAFRSPGPVLLAFALNYGLIPVLGWLLMRFQQSPDLRFGLMIAATVPCTTAAASVMTRKGGGNDAVSLLVTLSTNLLCFFLTPLWLRWTTATTVDFEIESMMWELVQAVLAPTLLGQALRLAGPLRDFATRYKTEISTAAQVLIEVMVFSAALKAGVKLQQLQVPPGPPVVSGELTTPLDSGDTTAVIAESVTLTGVLVVLASVAGIHLAVLAVGWFTSRALGIARPEATAVAFAGSQKTLPIGLYVASHAVAAPYPFAIFPMLLYHTSQLFLDTAIASRLKPPDPPPPAPPPLSG